MTRMEFTNWLAFYELHPFDDFHRIHRPAALVANSMAGTKIDDLLEFLQPTAKAPDANYSQADLNTLAAFGRKPKKKG